MERLVSLFTLSYFFMAIMAGIDLGFGWDSVALFLGSLCALSAGSGLKAALYNSAPKLGFIGSAAIILVGIFIVNSADNIHIRIGGISLDAQQWVIFGGIIFFVLTPKSLTE